MLPIFSIPYLLFLFVELVLAYIVLSKSLTRSAILQINFLAFLLGFLFFGLRGLIGYDWYNYTIIYNEIPIIWQTGFFNYLRDSLIEPGFILYTSILKSLFNSYYLYTAFSSLLDFSIIYIVLNRYVSKKYIVFSFVVYLTFGGFYLNTDLMRNVKSMGLFLLSIPSLIERRPLKFFLFNLIGITFHLTSVIYLACYWLLKIKISRKHFIILFVVGNILFLSKIEYIKPIIFTITDVLGGKFSYLANFYLNMPGVSGSYGITIGYLERFISAVVVIWFFNEIVSESQLNRLFVNAFIFFFTLFFFFNEIGTVGARLGLLFNFGYWMLFPLILQKIKYKIGRTIFFLGVALYSLLRMNGMSNTIIYSYHSILIGGDNLEEKRILFERQRDSNEKVQE